MTRMECGRTVHYLESMSISIPSIEELFSSGGALPSLPGFEYRPQQAAMAAAVLEALQDRRNLIVEAPTGVGKTLAYLLPAMIHALQNERKVLVSTHTKTLQDQLVRKDIPLATRLLGRDIGVAVLKGRQNYLCTTRLQNAVDGMQSLFDKKGREEVGRIVEWSHSTVTGDLDDLPFLPRQDVREMISSEPGICSSARCGSRCFFQRAKLRAREATVVVLNHALFFSLLSFTDSDEYFLFPGDFLILDEAHTVEATAGAGLGMKVSRRQLLGAMHRLSNPKTKRGLIVTKKKKFTTLCAKAEASVDDFFTTLDNAARMQVSGRERENYARRAIRVRYPRIIDNSIADPLAALLACAREEEEDCSELFQKHELGVARRTLQDLVNAIDSFLEQRDPDLTYWIELPERERGNPAICGAPSDVSTMLGARLFLRETPVILTSASLSVQGSLDYFAKRLGAGSAQTLLLDSPFDFARSMTIAVARDMPEPESEGYLRELAPWIMRSVDRTHGKSLVLFTNAHVMKEMASALGDQFETRGIRLLVQGRDGQRHALLEQFREDVESVLFGLESFWMGIDVPGEALKHVVITRLPFAVPNHPLIEARLEAIAEREGNAFGEYTLPEAVLRLKQGVGRLIRSRDDSGIITILDSRILRKNYGSTFIRSLPRCPLEILSASGETQNLEIFDP